jgi:hypothetical protein
MLPRMMDASRQHVPASSDHPVALTSISTDEICRPLGKSVRML